MNSYEVYKAYLALKLHFTDKKYDFFKYKGGINASVTSFNKKPDNIKRAFETVSRMREPKTYLVGNFICGSETFIRNFNEDNYLKYRKFLTNGNYIFKQEIGSLKVPYKQNFGVDSKETIPYIIHLVSSGSISIYTASILDRCFGWTDKVDNPLLDNLVMHINKSSRFFKFDSNKFKKILIDNTKSKHLSAEYID